MNKKDNLLYFSIIFATLAMLASLNMQIKLIAMLFLIVAVFMLDSQDGFVLTIFSLCFLNNLQYSWVTSVAYFIIVFELMLKAIFLYRLERKIGKLGKLFIVLTVLYFLISPIVKSIVFGHFSLRSFSFVISLLCIVAFVCYAYNHINFKKLGRYLTYGVIASFGLAMLSNATGMIGGLVVTSKFGNITITSLADANLIFALSVVAQTTILAKIVKKQASIFDIVLMCVLGVISIFGCPTISLIVQCLLVAIIAWSLIKNKEKVLEYSITFLACVVVCGIAVALVVNAKNWTLFDMYYKEVWNLVYSNFENIKGAFSTILYLIFGRNLSVEIDNFYITFIYNFGVVGVAICFVYLVWVIKNMFKNGSNKNYWGMVLAIVLSVITGSVASIMLLVVSVLSIADQLNPNCIDEQEKLKYGLYALLKRTFDIVVSFVAIVILFIPMVLVAIINAIFAKVPPIVKIKRVGKDGKTFYLYKFRSMYVDAESRIEHYLTKEQLEIWQRERKIDNDPRITKVGKFIRKTSLDELPQLFNILFGDLSIIGNRPLSQVEYDTHFSDDEKKLLDKMRPGLTGYWQVYGRSNVTFLSGERQKMYLHYSKHANIWLDIKIFFKTFVVVLSRKGAK